MIEYVIHLPLQIVAASLFTGTNQITADNFNKFYYIFLILYYVMTVSYIIQQAISHIIFTLIVFEALVVCIIIRREKKLTLPELYF